MTDQFKESEETLLNRSQYVKCVQLALLELSNRTPEVSSHEKLLSHLGVAINLMMEDGCPPEQVGKIAGQFVNLNLRKSGDHREH